MKSYMPILLLLMLPALAIAQETVVTITPNMLDPNDWSSVKLGDKDGWVFKQGNDRTWAKTDINTAGWKRLKPTELTDSMADKNGKLEGWFRIKIKLDTSFGNRLLTAHTFVWAASEMYVDGQLFKVAGNTGINGKPFREDNYRGTLPLAFNVEKGKEHLVAIHFVDFLSPLPPHHLESKDFENRLPYFLTIHEVQGDLRGYYSFIQGNLYRTAWLSVNGILCLLFWLLAFQNRTEKNLVLIALNSTVFLLMIYCISYYRQVGGSYIGNQLASLCVPILVSAVLICTIVLMLRIFRRTISTISKLLIGTILVCGILPLLFVSPIFIIFEIVLAICFFIYCIISSWKTLKGAQWTIVAGSFSTIFFGLVSFVISMFPQFNNSYTIANLLNSAVFFSGPLSLLVYVSMRFKEIIQEVRENSQKVIQLSEEKKEQALNQQRILQEEVNQQTAVLRQTLDHLKATQSQLIQSEKMASLGELTAGIAHEIQNPLNFVNNFSDVNTELLEELKTELGSGNQQEAVHLAEAIIVNEEKIKQHGRRADAIVKGMLQHSRASTGKKEPTDLNALADEYLRLSYHGMRAQDKDFNATIETNFDESIGKIEVVPQDIGRVLLNLYNNAFYAVAEKKKHQGDGYLPTVKVATKRLDNKIEIIVTDNGTGIPDRVVDKIFQPFFTTKPTGQGTGLGLSLSYDIVRAHGGELKVETKEGAGAGAEFNIQLPISNNM